MTYDPRNAFSEQQAAFGRASGVTTKKETSIRPKARPGSLGAKKDDKPKVTFKSAFEAAGGNTKKKEKQNVFPMKVYESPRFKIPEPAYVSTSTLDDAPSSPDPILDMPNVRSFMAPRQSEPFKGYVAGEEPVSGRSPGRGLMSPPQPEAPNVPQYQDAIMRGLTKAQMETIPRPKIRPALPALPALRQDSNTQKLLKIREASNYDTLYSNAEKTKDFKNVKVTDMTLGEVIEFTRASNSYGQWVKPRLPKDSYAAQNDLTSTPVGKYQIVGTTLRSLVNNYDYDLDTKFDKDTQDKMFLQLAKEKLDSATTMEEKVSGLRDLWEGFEPKYGTSYEDLVKVVQEIEESI